MKVLACSGQCYVRTKRASGCFQNRNSRVDAGLGENIEIDPVAHGLGSLLRLGKSLGGIKEPIVKADPAFEPRRNGAALVGGAALQIPGLIADGQVGIARRLPRETAGESDREGSVRNGHDEVRVPRAGTGLHDSQRIIDLDQLLLGKGIIDTQIIDGLLQFALDGIKYVRHFHIVPLGNGRNRGATPTPYRDSTKRGEKNTTHHPTPGTRQRVFSSLEMWGWGVQLDCSARPRFTASA